MKVKMILPALTEAKSPFWRPIKYHLFPPLGLATLAGYLSAHDEIILQDEHVETLDLSDTPNLVVIQVYITSAYRAYQIADHYRSRGIFVCLGGLHVTTLPEEAMPHADAIFLGPGEDTWPAFLSDFRQGNPQKVYQSSVRILSNLPPIRRDLFKRHHYLVPNSLVVSRGCPHHCDFCYKDSFFAGGKSYYTQSIEVVFTEIDTLPGRHLYFLDDHLFANQAFIRPILSGLQGQQRVWQSAGTVASVLTPGLMELAASAGLRSLFIGFETINSSNLALCNKKHNQFQEYTVAIRILRDLGIMINASFVFGMDQDDPSVFSRTVDWALEQGIQTATFHILTPYPGTKLRQRLQHEGRINANNWDLYDTRHAVFQPRHMTHAQLESGYRQAYHDFYRFSSIFKSAGQQQATVDQLRHLAYVCGWKKFEPLWDFIIRCGLLPAFLPLLEGVLDGGHNTIRSSLPVTEQTGAESTAFD
jgi:radical SAM superfamily enzyme YgiQ (UPF0313 family)